MGKEATQQVVAADLAERRAFQVFHPDWDWLAGGGVHAATAKRLNRTVRSQKKS